VLEVVLATLQVEYGGRILVTDPPVTGIGGRMLARFGSMDNSAEMLAQLGGLG
jgi:hypothetical protein